MESIQKLTSLSNAANDIWYDNSTLLINATKM